MHAGRVITAGAAGFGVLAGASTTETIVPRSASDQALVSGASGIAGFAGGALAGAVGTRLPTRAAVVGGAGLAAVGTATWLATGASSSGSSNATATIGFTGALAGTALLTQRALAGVHRGPLAPVIGGVVGVGAGSALVGAAALAARGDDRHENEGSRPDWAAGGATRAGVAGATAVAGGLGAAALAGTAGYVGRRGPAFMLGAAAVALATTGAGAFVAYKAASSALGAYGDRMLDETRALPATATGGPASGIPRDQLPAVAATYLTGTTSSERIRSYWPDGDDAGVLEPIRAFSPLAADGDIGRQADEAIAELDRLGAFERADLHVIMPTGTGDIGPSNAAIPEIMARGDIATIGLQYADEPSLFAVSKADDGAALLGAFLERVERRLEGVAEADRPRVLVSGYSLGAEVIRQARADDATKARMDRMVDGTQMIGPRNLRAAGDDGIEDATHARDATDIPAATPDGDQSPRTLIVRHVSDPAGNGTGSLALQDVRDPYVIDDSPFIPVATLVGTASDMKVVGFRNEAVGAPWRGHGYSADLTDATRYAFGYDEVPTSVVDGVRDRTLEMMAK